MQDEEVKDSFHYEYRISYTVGYVTKFVYGFETMKEAKAWCYSNGINDFIIYRRAIGEWHSDFTN